MSTTCTIPDFTDPKLGPFASDDCRKYFPLFIRIDRGDGASDGRVSSDRLTRFIRKKERNDFEWQPGDSRNLRRFAPFFPRMYQEWCRVPADPAVAEVHSALPAPVTAIIEINAAELDPPPKKTDPIRPPPPERLQLVLNFFADRPEVTGLFFTLMAAAALLLFKGGRRVVQSAPPRATPVMRPHPALPRTEERTVSLAHPAKRPSPLAKSRVEDHGLSVTVRIDSPTGRLILATADTVAVRAGGKVRLAGPTDAGGEGTLAALLGPRPAGRIQVGVREGPGGDRLAQQLTAVRELDAVDFTADELLRRVTVQFEGWGVELDAPRFERFLGFSKRIIDGMIKEGTYRSNHPDALKEYKKLVAITKAWHGGARGHHRLPILPGGRFSLNEEARRLLYLEGGLELPAGREILVTQTCIPLGKDTVVVTMDEISRASQRLSTAAGDQPNLREAIYSLLEQIYEIPYFKTSF